MAIGLQNKRRCAQKAALRIDNRFRYRSMLINKAAARLSLHDMHAACEDRKRLLYFMQQAKGHTCCTSGLLPRGNTSSRL